jgi:hypothetical protein
MTAVQQLIVVSQTKTTPTTGVGKVALFKADGTPFPAATFSQAAAQADVAALTQAAITGGESPTETEFNNLRTDHANTRTVLNSLLAKLRTAGIIAT